LYKEQQHSKNKNSRYLAPNAKQVAHMQRGQSRQQKRQLLVFFELPSLPSASRRSYGFLWAVQLFKNVRKDNPTPAYSPVSDRKLLTALVEVHWARRAQAPMPQISEPN
jgi:hypothetical protein